MNIPVHNPPDGLRRIVRWYEKAQIDYTRQYISLYVSYNTWYREVTGTTNDRAAIAILKKRFIIWDDYCSGRSMASLGLYLERLVDLTQKAPLSSSSIHWGGELSSKYDWRSLIEYWYRVRCLLVHGEDVSAKHVWLAYETLDVFMNEIIHRMQSALASHSAQPPGASIPVDTLATDATQEMSRVQRLLYQKYLASPDIWQVDMQSAQQDSE